MFGRGVTAIQITVTKDTGQNSVLKLLKDAQETRYNEHEYNISLFKATFQIDTRSCSNPSTEAKMEDILKSLCKRNINAPIDPAVPPYCTPLYLCVVMNNAKGVKKLLHKGPGANIGTTALNFQNLLCVAAYYGFHKLIPVLIDGGFSITHEPGAYTPLVLAAQYGNLPFVKAITMRKEYDPACYCWSHQSPSRGSSLQLFPCYFYTNESRSF